MCLQPPKCLGRSCQYRPECTFGVFFSEFLHLISKFKHKLDIDQYQMIFLGEKETEKKTTQIGTKWFVRLKKKLEKRQQIGIKWFIRKKKKKNKKEEESKNPSYVKFWTKLKFAYHLKLSSSRLGLPER